MTALAIYGRTYLDAELEVPIADLAQGKGKVDVEVRAMLGGFPCNAARALAGRLPATEVAIATRIPAIDLPRLRAAVPAGTQLIAALDETTDWPPITVIVNPAAECRLLRSGRAGDLRAADIEAVNRGALPSANVHVFSRVDASLVGDVRRAAPDSLLAWCAGAAAPLSAIDPCDIACVNTAEARELVASIGDANANVAAQTDANLAAGSDARLAGSAGELSTRDLATILAMRAHVGAMGIAVRVVTGRGSAPTAAAVRTNAGVKVFESAPPPVPRDQIRRVLRVGDVFAARFVVEATLDERGHRRDKLEVERALIAAQAAAGEFMVAT